MPQSIILTYTSGLLKESELLKWAYKQVDPDEEFKYQSVITASLQEPVLALNKIVSWVANQSYVSRITSRIDLKSVILFIFIVSQVIFPGYGTEDTGIALLPGSPTGSIAHGTGFALNLMVFALSFGAVLLVFIKDLAKNPRAFRLSKFEIILVFFLMSLVVSSIFSTYTGISFVWLIKVLRGVSVYFIFSRLILKKGNFISVCFAFLVSIYIEGALAIIQYLHGGFIGLPIESANNTTTVTQLYTVLNNTPIFRPTGTLSQENVLSFFIAFSIPFVLVLFLSKKSITKIFAGAGLILGILTTLLTLSRWGFITIIFSSVTFIFLNYVVKPKKLDTRPLLWVAGTITILLFVVFAYKADFSTRFLALSGNDGSLTSRMQLIIQSIYVVAYKPLLGTGGGTFSQYLVANDYTPLNIAGTFPAPVHNIFLLLLSESGSIASLFFASLILYLILTFIRNSLVKKTNISPFIVALFVSFLTYIFSGLWTIKGLDEHLIIVFWIVIGQYFNENKKLATDLTI